MHEAVFLTILGEYHILIYTTPEYVERKWTPDNFLENMDFEWCTLIKIGSYGYKIYVEEDWGDYDITKRYRYLNKNNVLQIDLVRSKDVYYLVDKLLQTKELPQIGKIDRHIYLKGDLREKILPVWTKEGHSRLNLIDFIAKDYDVRVELGRILREKEQRIKFLEDRLQQIWDAPGMPGANEAIAKAMQ